MTLPAAALAVLSILAPGTERLRGVARLADGRVAYVEEHELELRDGRLARAEIKYLDPEGHPIAWSRSEFRGDPYAPDYEFLDLRTGNRHLVRPGPDGLLLADGDRRRVLSPGRDRLLVVGEGIERYARDHLDLLARGEVLPVLLALPGQLGAYDFRLRAERSGGTLRIHLEPESLILRLFAPSISADYDLASGRLVRYHGISNLSAADGSALSVEIDYADTGVS